MPLETEKVVLAKTSSLSSEKLPVIPNLVKYLSNVFS